MHTRYSLLPTFALFTGLFFAFVAFSPTSVLAQRTAETVDTAPERVKRTPKTSGPAPKSSHAPATTIENADGDLIFQVSEGGSLLAPGLGGAIPAEGAGARMMWYPNQYAFRAGRVGATKDGTQWDADSIGTYSAAFGVDTKASHFGSMAIGEETVASGIDAMAMGYQTTASGLLATAMGWGTEASGDEAVAMGNNTIASGEESVAMGNNTTASATRSTAMGNNTEASEPNAVAMGTISKARGENALAVGFDAFTTVDHSLAAGRCNSGAGLLVVGNGPLNSAGTSCDDFSDAFELEENGDLEIAGSLTENSDRRLKTDVEPLGEEVVSALREIDPVRFRFEDERTHPSGEQLGLIAQEVQKEFPELVSEGDDGMLSVSYTKFSAVLLKGLQEQQSTIGVQQAQISDLKAENDQIKERLAALEGEQTAPVAASLFGPWGLALLLGLGGLAGGVLWRRRS